LKRRIAIILTLIVVLSLVCSTAMAASFDKVVYANADPRMYKVEVDLTNKIVTVFTRDSEGAYTKVTKRFICTTGAQKTKTPTGSFEFNEYRRRFGYFSKFSCYAQYWVNVKGGIYFHSILYNQRREGTFTRSSYNQLGKQASHGCIRMLVEDVRWLYYNIPAGTKGVIVYNEPNEELRQSLLPTKTYKEYKPEADQYEATKRAMPIAVLKADAYMSPEKGDGEKTLVAKGTAVTVVSSGYTSCLVKVDGQRGYIKTTALSFVPNGPVDTSAVHYVRNESAVVYQRANVGYQAGDTIPEGTILRVIASTTNFYKVEYEGANVYVLKKDVASVTADEYNKLFGITPVTEKPTEEPFTEDSNIEEETEEPLSELEDDFIPDESSLEDEAGSVEELN